MRTDQGRHHPARAGAGRRLRSHAQLLRPGRGRHAVRPLRQLQASRKRIRRGGLRRSSVGVGTFAEGRRRPVASRQPQRLLIQRVYYTNAQRRLDARWWLREPRPEQSGRGLRWMRRRSTTLQQSAVRYQDARRSTSSSTSSRSRSGEVRALLDRDIANEDPRARRDQPGAPVRICTWRTGRRILCRRVSTRLRRPRTVGFHLRAHRLHARPGHQAAAGASLPRAGGPRRTASSFEDRPVGVRFVFRRDAGRCRCARNLGAAAAPRDRPSRGTTCRRAEGRTFRRPGSIGVIAVLSAERLRGRRSRRTRLRRPRADDLPDLPRCGRRLHPPRLGGAGGPARSTRAPAGRDKEQRRAARDLQGRLAGHEAAALAGGADVVDGVRQVVQALDGRDQNTLKSMALAICGAPGFRVALSRLPSRTSPCSLDRKDGTQRLRRRAQGAAGGVRRTRRRETGARTRRRPERRPRADPRGRARRVRSV